MEELDGPRWGPNRRPRRNSLWCCATELAQTDMT
jgi:hypothetical protein